MRRRFVTLDVFTEKRYAGNPLAVVLEPDGLDTAAMQAIARPRASDLREWRGGTLRTVAAPARSAELDRSQETEWQRDGADEPCRIVRPRACELRYEPATKRALWLGARTTKWLRR